MKSSRWIKTVGALLAILSLTVCVTFAEESSAVSQSTPADEIRQIVSEKSQLICELNRAVWSYAELGWQEHQSAAKLTAALEAEGFQVEKEIAEIPTAFVARYGSGSPVIGFLAEYDALPNLSQKSGCPTQTPIPENPNGHGCAHSVLGAGAVGGAIAVKEYLKRHPEMKGTIVLYGTPAEENGCGKTFMVKRGCFRDLDVFFSWHPSTVNRVASAKTLACYHVKYAFDGVSSHASGSPDQGRSALDACELMNVGVNYLREHVPTSSRIHYAYLDCGGSAPNVVPNHTEILYYIRGVTLADCNRLRERINEIARGAALMTETKVSIQICQGLSDFVTNRTAAKVLNQALHEMGAPSFEEPDYELARAFAKTSSPDRNQLLETRLKDYDPNAAPAQNYASTDDGDVSQIVPGARFNLATGIPGTPIHSWLMTAQAGSSIGDHCAHGAARVFARTAILFFEKPELVGAAQKEHSETLGANYQSPIPDGVQPWNF